MIEEAKTLQIQRMMKAMNATGWIKTVSSSQGRAGYLYQDGGSVSFYCLVSKVSDLCSVLNRIEQNSKDPVSLQLHIIHNLEHSDCQFFAPTGYLSLCLEFGRAKDYDKLFNLAAGEFTKIFMRTGSQDSYGFV